MGYTIKQLSDSQFCIHDITSLIHEAFEERTEQGIEFSCAKISDSVFCDKTRDAFVYVAYDNASGELIGTTTLHIYENGNGRYGSNEYSAVLSKYKGKGIGTALLHQEFKDAESHKCAYILSDTSINAHSSIKWHRSNGFRIIALHSYPTTKYFSFIFRKQLIGPEEIWAIRYYHLLLSVIKVLIKYKKDGTTTWIYSKVKGICKN